MNDNILKVNNLTKSFGGLKAVDEVSFKISEAQVTGLIGPNGAGKTTLFSVINGFLQPEEGEIFFREKGITGMKPHQICRRGLARTFQIVKPFGDVSVLDNIVTASLLRHPRQEAAREEARKIADLIGLKDKLNKKASNLPLAGIKRVGIAQALATEPKLILLDEALAGLNNKEINELLNTIRGVVSEGLRVFMIEHVMEAIMSISERILVMNKGKLIAKGTPKEISENEEVIEAYLGQEEIEV